MTPYCCEKCVNGDYRDDGDENDCRCPFQCHLDDDDGDGR